MGAHGACQLSKAARGAQTGPDSPAIVEMDLAISHLGAHAKLLSAMRRSARVLEGGLSVGGARAVRDIRQVIGSVGKERAERLPGR